MPGQLGQADFENGRHVLEVTSGRSGAFVVHDKVAEDAVFQARHLGVLAAEVDQGEGLQFRLAPGAGDVCLDFRDHPGVVQGQGVAAVAGNGNGCRGDRFGVGQIHRRKIELQVAVDDRAELAIKRDRREILQPEQFAIVDGGELGLAAAEIDAETGHAFCALIISRKPSMRMRVRASIGPGRSPSRVRTGTFSFWRTIMSSIWRKQKDWT